MSAPIVGSYTSFSIFAANSSGIFANAPVGAKSTPHPPQSSYISAPPVLEISDVCTFDSKVSYGKNSKLILYSGLAASNSAATAL
ncbi:hypothetical protein SDC9_196917 [bioreactor metagenome]|uniref:Uncharacterized protein n=1 Tax=bioreactor metagenome TaxID=1076179 RepID=A0A645IDV3_9ZZZZ